MENTNEQNKLIRRLGFLSYTFSGAIGKELLILSSDAETINEAIAALSNPAAADSDNNDALDALYWKEKYEQATGRKA